MPALTCGHPSAGLQVSLTAEAFQNILQHHYGLRMLRLLRLLSDGVAAARARSPSPLEDGEEPVTEPPATSVLAQTVAGLRSPTAPPRDAC